MPAFGSVVANNVGAGTAGNTVTKPAGTIDGDLLLVLCAGNSGTVQTVTPPANGTPGVGDWVAGPTDTSAAWNISTFWKLAWTSEPASYTFTRTGTLGNFTVTIVRVTGADPSSPIAAAGIAGSGGTANIVLPSLAAAAAGTLLTQMLSQTGTAATVWTAPASTTKRYDTTSSGSAIPVVGGDETVGAGASGTRTWSRTGAGPAKAVVWAINPPAPQAVSPSGRASTAAVGSPTITRGAVTVAPSGRSSTAVVGSPTLTRGAVSVAPAGIGSTTQLGSPTVQGSAPTITPSGIASTVAVGTPSVAGGGVTVSPSGIAPTATVGAPTVQRGSVSIAPAGVVSSASMGTPSVARGAVHIVTAGIGSTADLGAPQVARGAVSVAPEGIASTAAVGSPTVVRLGTRRDIAISARVAPPRWNARTRPPRWVAQVRKE